MANILDCDIIIVTTLVPLLCSPSDRYPWGYGLNNTANVLLLALNDPQRLLYHKNKKEKKDICGTRNTI